ncbi:hypothetical protein EYF80_065676 [Liparis tanakae]|uniref:Uncharacterized protein n=1 Tax=Liparis tanakae TaxID=230148 RepID=A0A4Z2E613_9TELE|nr:hypothetical protein EYF80_065676 [Liparis tanakae]
MSNLKGGPKKDTKMRIRAFPVSIPGSASADMRTEGLEDRGRRVSVLATTSELAA